MITYELTIRVVDQGDASSEKTARSEALGLAGLQALDSLKKSGAFAGMKPDAAVVVTDRPKPFVTL